jgi:primosomal protein N' (replication factor Y)
MITVLNIAVPCPLRRSFDYLSNDHTIAWTPGLRVEVPFGSRQLIGVVLSVSEKEPQEITALKPIIRAIDTVSILPSELLVLTKWISDYYHHAIGDCFQAVMPKQLRKGKVAEIQQDVFWNLTEVSEQALGKKQQEVVNFLKQYSEPLSQQHIYQELGQCRSVLNALEQKSLISQTFAPKRPVKNETPTECILNSEQQRLIDNVNQSAIGFSPYLLHGITGSGKTEVYIELAKQELKEGKQVLVLIPEIGLTNQFVERFKQRLSAHIVVLHSAISDGERTQSWLLAQQGLIDIVIGTRSAVFTPLPRLGLIVIDEEHDASYKQQDGLRYHARNIALVRAQRSQIPIILGSATPSLESLLNVEQERFKLLSLTERATGAKLPKVTVVDSDGPKADSALSSFLFDAIQREIKLGNQVLLFINRRGFAPVLMCHECGWQATCVHCDAKLIVHQQRNLLCCHHCGAMQRLLTDCPKCHHPELNTYGAGTEQIEHNLERYFPDVPVLRIDRDSTQRVNAFSELIEDINKGEPRILVGTQMLAKGHDFHNVTLVGVLDADQGLFSADFRASESLAQLVVQVTGRAGRGDKKGEVIIQTSQPSHPFWNELLKKGYSYSAKKILQERQALMMPPYGALCIIRAEDKQNELAMNLLSEMLVILNENKHQDVMVYGPVPAMMEKRAGRYRAQLMISCLHRKPLHQLLDASMDALSSLKLARKVRWSIDIDPHDLM